MLARAAHRAKRDRPAVPLSSRSTSHAGRQARPRLDQRPQILVRAVIADEEQVRPRPAQRRGRVGESSMPSGITPHAPAVDAQEAFEIVDRRLVVGDDGARAAQHRRDDGAVVRPDLALRVLRKVQVDQVVDRDDVGDRDDERDERASGSARAARRERASASGSPTCSARSKLSPRPTGRSARPARPAAATPAACAT